MKLAALIIPSLIIIMVVLNLFGANIPDWIVWSPVWVPLVCIFLFFGVFVVFLFFELFFNTKR